MSSIDPNISTGRDTRREGDRLCVKVKAYVRRDGVRVKEHYRCYKIKPVKPEDQEKVNKAKAAFAKRRGEQPKEGAKQKPGSASFVETINTYKKDGVWDTDRQELHESIEAEVFKDIESKKGKTFYMMGGAPSNGKSTFIESEYNDMPMDSLVEINADQIKDRLPEYRKRIDDYLKKGISSKAAAAMVHEESSELSKRFVKRSTSEGYNVLLDGTGDNSIDNLRSKVSGYRSSGHRVVANYTTLDTDLALKINEIRYKNTGRYVPPEYIRKVSRTLANIVPIAIEENLFDEFRLYDTNTKGVAKLIAQQLNGEFKILDDKLWKRFLDKKND